jgi:putative Holliday junction resolvase
MRYLGIDYGSRRVGIALSDETGSMAFPKQVLPQGAGLLQIVLTICKEEGVGAIVIGESKDYLQQDNRIMEQVRQFKADLEGVTGLPVYLEPEFMSSTQAEKLQGKNEMLDASAAAIILQSYLDKLKFKK